MKLSLGIINLCTKWRRVVTFALRRYPFFKKLIGAP